MRPRAFFAVAGDLAARGPRKTYWAASAFMTELSHTRKHGSAPFRRHVVGDLTAFVGSTVRPIEDQAVERARAAVAWLLRAQQAGGDGGVSYGYFPGIGPPWGWKRSYPETTGYIMTSLLAFARRFPSEAIVAAVFRMARWEADIQMASGAVQGGPVCAAEQQTAAAFNTGMVLDGWCSVLEQFPQQTEFYEPARRAADWLVGDVNEGGYFRTNGAFVSSDSLKTYTCLCAWAMYRFGKLANSSSRYQDTAIRVIEAAIAQQRSNGWFANNCLTNPKAPLTHTIGYTLQGVLEVGVLSGRRDFVEAARRSIESLKTLPSKHGYLPGRLDSLWRAETMSSCLTGSAQIAIVAYRLYQLLGDEQYRRFGDRLLNYIKPLQVLQSEDDGIVGALPGSFPILGSYMRGGYPNWATKYLLDALLLQIECAPGRHAGTETP
jgi:hypothetical protein